MHHESNISLLEILEDRYGDKSTVIASQIPPENWYDLFRNSTEPDIHLGYNLIRIGSVLEILARETNAGSQVFSFGVNLPAPWNNVPFQIVAAGSPLSTPPISAGTFSTFSVGNTIDIPSSTCTNCANSSPGDRFIILAPLDLVTRIYMDWTGLDFTAGRP